MADSDPLPSEKFQLRSNAWEVIPKKPKQSPTENMPCVP